MTDLLVTLRAMGACDEAREWVMARADHTLSKMWSECQRGDWMLWLASRVGVDRRRVVLAACDCAEPVLVYLPSDEERPRRAIEAARRWARGDATLDEVRAAADDACDAYIANELASGAAAYAIAYAVSGAPSYARAYASVHMHVDADVVVVVANTYASAITHAAEANAAAEASLARSADIVREHINAATIEDAFESYCEARCER